MRLTTILIITCTLSVCSCGHNNSPSHKLDTAKKAQPLAVKEDTVSGRDTTTKLQLAHGFKVIAGEKSRHTGFSTFFELWHDSKKMYVDTTNNFEFEKQPPVLNELRPNVFELLMEFDNNPNKNLTLVLRIEQDKIVKKDTVATFTGKQENVDGMIVRSGAWDYSEEWDEKGIRYITFDPVLYYKFTQDGVKLDSVITRERTKEKYGNVDPFDHTEQIGFPVDEKNHIDTITKHIYRKKIDE